MTDHPLLKKSKVELVNIIAEKERETRDHEKKFNFLLEFSSYHCYAWDKEMIEEWVKQNYRGTIARR